MTHFISTDRPDVRAALKALANVENGWDRVVAHFAAPRMAQWATNNYGPVKKASWWGWILGKPQRGDYRGLPGDDHVEYREKDGVRVRISEPYDMRWDDLRALVRHCEENGLEASIHGGSCWFPGWTFSVVVKKRRES